MWRNHEQFCHWWNLLTMCFPLDIIIPWAANCSPHIRRYFWNFFTDGVVLHGSILTITQTLLVANVRFFFKRSVIQWNQFIIFLKVFLPFCLNGYIIVAFDVTKVLFPFSICVLACVSLGSTTPIITKYTIYRSQKKQH